MPMAIVALPLRQRQPTRPAPMSGVSAVKTTVGRGGSPVLAATIGSERRGNAPRRPQGLALTARGPQGPQIKEEGQSAEGWPTHFMREGSSPNGRDAMAAREALLR